MRNRKEVITDAIINHAQKINRNQFLLGENFGDERKAEVNQNYWESFLVRCNAGNRKAKIYILAYKNNFKKVMLV
jgi:hypothetical protein